MSPKAPLVMAELGWMAMGFVDNVAELMMVQGALRRRGRGLRRVRDERLAAAGPLPADDGEVPPSSESDGR